MKDIGRRRKALKRLLDAPHPESPQVAEEGFDEWAKSLSEENTDALVNPSEGAPVRWTHGRGWVKGDE